jgi:hypothetical protein
MDEDILISITLKKTAMYAGVGTDQKFDTYWAGMKELFDSHNKSGYERMDRSLHSWCGVISSECQNWSAVLADVDKVNPSGTTERDKVICFLLVIHTSFISCYSYFFLTCFVSCM